MSYSPYNYAARFKAGEYICPYCGSEEKLSVMEKFPNQKEWACGICGKTWAETTADMVKAALDPTVRIENLARQALNEVLEERASSDPVNHPKHYTSGGIECIEAIKEALGEHFVGYLRGNVLKYIWRFDKKEKPLEDLEKAKWYLNYLIDYERSIDEREQNL